MDVVFGNAQASRLRGNAIVTGSSHIIIPPSLTDVRQDLFHQIAWLESKHADKLDRILPLCLDENRLARRVRISLMRWSSVFDIKRERDGSVSFTPA